MRVYIAGPMTGYPEYNYPAFRAAARRYKRAGAEVLDPSRNFGGRTDLPKETYMRRDIQQLLSSHGVILLPGWQESEGARFEILLANQVKTIVLEDRLGFEAETLQDIVKATGSRMEARTVAHGE